MPTTTTTSRGLFQRRGWWWIDFYDAEGRRHRKKAAPDYQTAKIIRSSFRDLRHDAASTLTMAGVPQRTVMAILGHKDPRMTMPYQHLSPGHLRDAMRALEHPPATSAAPQAEAR